MPSGLAKTILQGTVREKRSQDRQKKRLEDIIKEWKGRTRLAELNQLKTRLGGRGLL